jgi:hypothetical protein
MKHSQRLARPLIRPAGTQHDVRRRSRPDQRAGYSRGSRQLPNLPEPLKARCGQIVTWHWAHLAREDCDPWAEPDTVWHRG